MGNVIREFAGGRFSGRKGSELRAGGSVQQVLWMAVVQKDSSPSGVKLDACLLPFTPRPLTDQRREALTCPATYAPFGSTKR